MQGFVLQDEARLAGGIEFFFCAVAGRDMSFSGLHLAGGGESADQDALGVGNLRFRRSLDRRG